jgi:hypothetical protein
MDAQVGDHVCPPPPVYLQNSEWILIKSGIVNACKTAVKTKKTSFHKYSKTAP